MSGTQPPRGDECLWLLTCPTRTDVTTHKTSTKSGLLTNSSVAPTINCDDYREVEQPGCLAGQARIAGTATVLSIPIRRRHGVAIPSALTTKKVDNVSFLLNLSAPAL